MLSRPCLVLRTRPEFCITRKCLVIAWRVMSKPVVSLVMDAGPSSQRRETSRKRVSSANAANSGAEPRNPGTAFGLRCLGKVLLDQLYDHTPALLVRFECLCPTSQWDLIEAGFGDG